MRPNPLRAEFVLVGLLLILSLAWLALAFRNPGEGLETLNSEWTDISTGGAVLLAAIAIGVAYVVGAVVVQATFTLFARDWLRGHARLHHRERLEALDDLLPNLNRDTDLYRVVVAAASTPTSAPPEAAASASPPAPAEAPEVTSHHIGRWARRWLGLVSRDSTFDHKSVAADLETALVRARMPEAITRELEYRRANRQVFLGFLPSVPIMGLACMLSFAAGSWIQVVAVIVVTPLVVVTFSGRLLNGARYQEQAIAKTDQLVLFARATRLDPDSEADD